MRKERERMEQQTETLLFTANAYFECPVCKTMFKVTPIKMPAGNMQIHITTTCGHVKVTGFSLFIERDKGD